ncbi:MAG: MFS transporter [Acidimicrobiia bacterium]
MAETTDRFPGWSVVIASFVSLMTTSGLAFYGLAVYLNSLSKERGWSVSSISAAVAVFFLVGGLSGLVVARQMAKRDVRVIVVVGALLGAGALAMLGQVQEIWQVYLVYAVFSVGHTACGLVPATTVVTRWFHAKRSTALSVASTGLSMGGIALTPFVKWALDRYGLSATTPWLAVVWLVGIVPVTLLLMHPDPARLGWLPDGVRAAPHTTPRPPAGVPFASAVRTRFFYAVTVAYVFVLGSQVGAIQQLVKLVEERTGEGTATIATSALAGTSVVARLAGGQIAARTSMVRLALVMAVLQAIALALISVFESTLLLFGAIVLFGATIGNILMLHPLLIGEAFGVLDYPRIFSRSQFFAFVGTAFGPYLLGWLHDHAGGYRTSYLVAAACSIIGAAALARSGTIAAAADGTGWSADSPTTVPAS